LGQEILKFKRIEAASEPDRGPMAGAGAQAAQRGCKDKKNVRFRGNAEVNERAASTATFAHDPTPDIGAYLGG